MSVYYLPGRTPELDDVLPAPTRRSVLHARAHRFWWRVRLTTADVWSAFRRRGRMPLEEHVWFADVPPVIPQRRRTIVGPARVLDLDAARRRRRLAAAAGV